MIKHLLNTNTPCFIGRIADIELAVAYRYIIEESTNLDELRELENKGGIYISGLESLRKYAYRVLDTYHNCSAIVELDELDTKNDSTDDIQDFIRELTLRIPKIPSLELEPYLMPEPTWISSLRNKRILVVHPFTLSLQYQSSYLKELFPEREWFEGCEFEFIQPPITLANNHFNIDWEESYNLFIQKYKRIQTESYDIVLISAGGYGMLIADFIFRYSGKTVIYVGAYLQLYFGVIGKRWIETNAIAHITNEYWARPCCQDRPKRYKQVEDGCYW
jgi:hypothetical protein